ncbi:MAG: cobaltochelatase subunit CobT, partial [Dongiaceae bacterium]
MTKENTDLDPFKRATAAALRAVAEAPDTEVVFRGIAPKLYPPRALIPDPLPSPELRKLTRGQADMLALKLRFHNAETHAVERPAFSQNQAQNLFDAAEELRLEVLGGKLGKGIAENLDAVVSDHFLGRIAAHPEPLFLSEAVQLLLREHLLHKPSPGFLHSPLAPFRAEIEPVLNQIIPRLNEKLNDQAAFAEIINSLLKQLDFKSDEGDQEEERPESAPEKAETSLPENAGQNPDSTSSAPGQPREGLLGDIPPSSLTGSGNLNEGGKMNAQASLPFGRPGATHLEPHYQVFTAAFDEIIAPPAICDHQELSQLRRLLDEQLDLLPSIVPRLANRLQRVLLAQQTRRWRWNEEEGFIDTARLARLVANPKQTAIYKTEEESDFRDTVVTLLLDNSGSMRGRPVTIAALCADILARTLERCSVKVEILGFTTRAWKGGQAREAWLAAGKPRNPGRLNDLRHIIYKAADQPYRRARVNLGLMLREGLLKENIDGEAILWAHERLLARPEERKILMVISDGAPVDDSTLSVNNGGYLEAHLRQAINWIERKSPVELAAIGIGHDVTRYYRKSATIAEVEELGPVLLNQMHQLLAPA